MHQAVEVPDRSGDELLDLEVLPALSGVEPGDAGPALTDRRRGEWRGVEHEHVLAGGAAMGLEHGPAVPGSRAVTLQEARQREEARHAQTGVRGRLFHQDLVPGEHDLGRQGSRDAQVLAQQGGVEEFVLRNGDDPGDTGGVLDPVPAAAGVDAPAPPSETAGVMAVSLSSTMSPTSPPAMSS
ncbi:hypothetical protein AB9128_06305 [Streptomyces cinereoruber]|uniref:hypothetical protein n=1 Tax=Streptomyces cinereoruber TaxID=67260 RepID=UPI003EC0EFBA